MKNRILVLFDGHCPLCNRTVQFILKHDREKQFIFSPLQSHAAKEITNQISIPQNIDSVVVIANNKAHYYSRGVFLIVRQLGFPWKSVLFFSYFPVRWTDTFYRWVAKNRGRWFGKNDTCMLPPSDYADRFI